MVIKNILIVNNKNLMSPLERRVSKLTRDSIDEIFNCVIFLLRKEDHHENDHLIDIIHELMNYLNSSYTNEEESRILKDLWIEVTLKIFPVFFFSILLKDTNQLSLHSILFHFTIIFFVFSSLI